VIDSYKNEINFVTLTKFDIALNLFTLYKNYYMFIASFFWIKLTQSCKKIIIIIYV
jgi:hypothetical protein